MYLKKGQEGAKTILDVITALRAKNLNFFRNTFNYYFTKHPPFANSSLCYDCNNNDYKFISNSQLNDLSAVSFKDYIPGDSNNLIKEHTFFYGVIDPHNVIIADANWIYNISLTVNSHNLIDLRDKATEDFYNWYKKVIGYEYSSFKNILNNKEVKQPNKKLFGI